MEQINFLVICSHMHTDCRITLKLIDYAYAAILQVNWEDMPCQSLSNTMQYHKVLL